MTGTTQFICYICNKPVDLESSKTDERGRAIHEECYVVATLLRARSNPLAEINARIKAYSRK